MKSFAAFKFLIICLFIVLIDLADSSSASTLQEEGIIKDWENLEHPDCTRCQANEFFELHNTVQMFPQSSCIKSQYSFPDSILVTGLAMTPGNWWEAQMTCQKFRGSLFEPIINLNTLEGLRLLATEAHKSKCAMKRRKPFQEYWTGFHFQPDLFNENDQPRVIGATTGTSMDDYVEHEAFYRDYFYDANPNRMPGSNTGSFESCVEMSSSTHQDGIRTHGRLNDEDCWVNNLPLCSFTYVAVLPNTFA